MTQHVGLGGQAGGQQVQRVVADDVGVVFEMLQHEPVVLFAVERLEAVLDLDGVSGPVHRPRIPQQRPPAPVEEASDDLVFRVVVGRPRVLVHVETGEAAHAALKEGVFRVGERLLLQDHQGFTDVDPVHFGVEFLEVHAVAGELHVGGLGQGVLPQVSLPGLLVHLQDVVGGAQRMKNGPVPEVLDGVVGTVEGAPPLGADQESPVIEVFLVEFPAGRRLRAQQLPLHHRPAGRRHGRVDGDLHLGQERATRQDQDECKFRAQVTHTVFRSFLSLPFGLGAPG